MADKPVCSIEDCFKPAFAKGWCASHFARWRDRGDPLGEPIIKVCSVTDCGRAIKANSLCSKHYSKFLKYGDPLGAAVKVIQTTCTMPGCEKPFVAKGYCRMHYNRIYTKGTPHREPMRIEKIMKFVDEVALKWTSDECLRHPFNVNDAGYCFINRGKRNDRIWQTLHRYVCEKKHGSAPHPSYDAAHECGNAWCVNPRHLFWKTRVDNMNDKRRHGTHIQGIKQWKATLTEEQVREIRELSKTTTQREIARRFGLGYKHVWHVLHDTWKHVEVSTGEKFRSTKLTDEQVREIRQLRNNTGMSYQAIGRLHDVSAACVCKICLGKIWKHVS